MARIPPHAHRQRRGPTQLFQQHFQERVDWGRAILEGGGGDEGAQWPRWHSQRGTRPPGWTAARSRCASGRHLCPQTVTARRGGVRGAAALAGAARERRSRRSGGRTGSTRTFEVGWRDRRAPGARGPWTHHLHPEGRCGGGGGHRWGAVGRHAGGLSGFGAPRAKMGCPSMSLTIGCGRQISGPHRIWAQVGSQGVPQTGKIIEVKRRLSGSFFSIPEVLAVLFGVAWLDRMSQERW